MTLTTKLSMPLAERVKKRAKSLGISISRFMADTIRDVFRSDGDDGQWSYDPEYLIKRSKEIDGEIAAGECVSYKTDGEALEHLRKLREAVKKETIGLPNAG